MKKPIKWAFGGRRDGDVVPVPAASTDEHQPTADDGAPAQDLAERPAQAHAQRFRRELVDVDDALAELRTRIAALDEPLHGASEGRPGLPQRAPLSDFTRPAPNAWLFRKHVLVSVGPFLDLQDVNGFAIALSGLPPKPKAEVWGFDGNQAVIKLSSEEPLRLADEDLRSLPYRPRVALATASALTLRLELPPLPRPPSDEGPVLPLRLHHS